MQPYDNLSEISTSRVLLDSVEKEVLADIVRDFLDSLDTSAAVYEKNGDYAIGIFTSSWCQFLNKASRDLCGTDDDRKALKSGAWHCHESCWTRTSKVSIETGQPADTGCSGGLRIYAVPIRAGEEIIGSIRFGYGDPPKEAQKLQEIADRYDVSMEELRKQADAYESRPPYIIEITRKRLMTSARLIGEIVKRRRAENAVLREKKLSADVIASSIDGILAYDHECCYTIWNRGMECISGVKAEEVLGKCAFDVFPFLKETGEDTFFYDALAGKAVIAADRPYRVPETGKQGFFEGRYYPLYDEAGRIRGGFAFIRDVTDRRKTEEEIASLSKFPSENPNPVLRLDRSGKILYKNERTAVVMNELGLSEKEIVKLLPADCNALISKTLDTGEMLRDLEVRMGDKVCAYTMAPVMEKGYVNLYAIDFTERRKAEEALQESKSRLLKAQHIARMGFWDWNLKTNEMYWSDEVYNIYGVDPQKEKGTLELTMQLLHPDDREFVEKNLDMAVKGVKQYDIDHRKVRPDGEVIWVHAQAELVRDADGTPVSLLGSVIDITGRKRAEEALMESEQRYSKIISTTHDAIMLFDADKRNFIEVNKACEDLYGYSRREFLSLRHDDITAEPKRSTVSLDKTVSKRFSKIPVRYHRKKDGTIFPVEISGSSYELAGQKVLCGIIRDITERMRAEEMLHQNEEKYRTLVNNIPGMVYSGRTDWSAEFVSNSEGMCGYSVDEFMTQKISWLDIIHPDDRERVVTENRRLGKKQPTLVQEYRIIAKDGSIRHIEDRKTARFAKGALTGVDGIIFDISARKESERALYQAYRDLKDTQQQLIQTGKMAAMGQLAAGISHELNQPLTGIKGFAQAILMDLKHRSPYKSDLERIIEQANRMSVIIQNVRFFARKAEFKMETLDIHKPLQDALSLISEQFKIHNIRLKKSFTRKLPKIVGDKNQLQQVFLNLITNARDAIDSLKKRRGGELSVETRVVHDGKHVEIIIQDTGCGIPEDHLSHIFNPFFTTKSQKGGTGLGLSIIYRILESHGGTIEVESAKGTGTKVMILLPVGRRKRSPGENFRRSVAQKVL